MQIIVECKDSDTVGAKECVAMALEDLVDIKFINVKAEEEDLGKQFYTDYVRHMARFYFRSDLGQRQIFKTVADERNWKSCHNAAKDFDKNFLIAVYGPGNDIGNNVIVAARRFEIAENTGWEIVKSFEDSAARKRGLI